MISQAKKTAVLEMLKKNKYSLRKISVVIGVSWGTVKALRDGTMKVKERNNTPMAMRRKAKPRICPKCGLHVAVWPCIACNPNHFKNHIALRPNIYRDMSTLEKAKEKLPALLCLANDLQELAALNEIDHPLFFSLANRSREIYNLILKNEKIDGEA